MSKKKKNLLYIYILASMKLESDGLLYTGCCVNLIKNDDGGVIFSILSSSESSETCRYYINDVRFKDVKKALKFGDLKYKVYKGSIDE